MNEKVACSVFLCCVVSCVWRCFSVCVCCLSVVLSVVSWLWASVSCSCVLVFVGCFGCLHCVGFLACSISWAVAGGWCLASLRVLVVVSCRLSFVVLCSVVVCCCMWLCVLRGRKGCMHRTRLRVYGASTHFECTHVEFFIVHGTHHDHDNDTQPTKLQLHLPQHGKTHQVQTQQGLTDSSFLMV